MRFSLTADQRAFFAKHLFVEFEDFSAVDPLNQAIEETLSQRLNTPVSMLHELPTRTIFDAGFDLWRSSEPIRKILFKSTFATIASELFQTLPLRMGSAQYLYTGKTPSTSPLPSLSLEATSCAKPLVGGWLLRLSADQDSPLPFEHNLCPLPMKQGGAVFLSAHKPIQWDLLFQLKDVSFLLMTYTTIKGIYHHESKDPHLHAWKRLGYVFGDRLNDTLHPILLR